MARSGQKIEEREALEVLQGWGVVGQFEWLEAGRKHRKRTPDLRVRLTTGRDVLVEVRMHTYAAARHLFSADGKEHPSSRLKFQWEIMIGDPAASEPSAETSESFGALVEQTLVPLLEEVESAGGTPQDMRARAQVRIEHAVQTLDSERPEWLSRSIRVWGTPKPAESGPGLVKTRASTSYGVFLEGVDDLVSAVQDCVDAKDRHGQGANWLVVALDGSRASQQLEEACDRVLSGNGARYSDIAERVDMRDFEEVWVFARSFSGDHHMSLRMTSAGAEWKRLGRVRSSAA